MSRPGLRVALVSVGVLVAAAVVTPGAASAGTFAGNDYCLGQCYDILPPGENGNATVADIALNKAFGTRPAHTTDQLDKYASLVDGYTGLTNGSLGQFFNSSAFGVPAGQVESTISPRSDVTIVRDRATGVPHITGTTRSGTEFGAGYASAQDRLWLMDLFRHVGRGQLTGFAGGAAGNRDLEQSFYRSAPYTEADLQSQIDVLAAKGGRYAQAAQDVNDYVAGINAYIAKSKSDLNFPGEYVLTGNADPLSGNGIQPFKPTDIVAIGGVLGAQFGAGGGGEVQSALVRLAAQRKYGTVDGDKVWRSFQEQNDPEAVLTVHNGTHFPYSGSPASPTGVAMPDWGSVTPQPVVYNPTGSAGSAAASSGIFGKGVFPADMFTSKKGMSNALLVSGQYTDDGHPIAVFGPQTGYFAPQLLMLEELQGPGISARGATFAGLGMYVLLGRGQDYSWSATSAGQDITDTFALDLCNTDGSTPTKDSAAYLYNGQCTPMERLSVHNAWSPTVADGTAAGSYDLVSFRTKFGLVQSRATINGKPVAYAEQRSTYRHEVDSVIGFQMLNDPAAVNSPQTFQQAASNINFTFNWFYTDSSHIAYFNSGWNPVRQPAMDPNLPAFASAADEWQGWNADTNLANFTPFSAHPQVVDQDYLVSWNNKQALDYTSAGFGNGPVHRVNMLDDRVKALVRSGTKVTRGSLAKAMGEAAVTDLRGTDAVPELLRVINSQPVTDPNLAAVVAGLADWSSHGAPRKEDAPGSKHYTYAQTVQIMDAWWPLLTSAEFGGLGSELYGQLAGALSVDEAPSHGQRHVGSSFQYGWWSYVDKDLRSVLGDSVVSPLSQKFCGAGNLAQCRTAMLNSLAQAVATPATTVYPGDSGCGAGDQWCADSIVQSPLGGITDYATNWQNRPTYQQVVQYPAHRGDNVANLAAGRSATASSYERPIFSANLVPGLAVDGNTGTRWASGNWADGEWITVDLGSSQRVNRVVLNWESAYGRAYKIQVSDTGSSWRDVYTTSTGDGGIDNDEFTATTARYVRMQGVSRATSYGYSLYEFEVYAH